MPTNINYRANIWALKQEGCTHVIVSTACGSLQEEIAPGDLVLLDQFIDRLRNVLISIHNQVSKNALCWNSDRTTKRAQTFYDGTKEDMPSICHLPSDEPFCKQTRSCLLQAAQESNIPIHSSGTCITIEGPRFSSKAESHLFKSWGAHVINMTTIPEVLNKRKQFSLENANHFLKGGSG